jgi:hypothetical protein
MQRIDDARVINNHKNNFVTMINNASNYVDQIRAFKATYTGDMAEIETLISQGRSLVQNLLDKIDTP